VYCSPAPCETSSKVLSISWNASLARPGRLISWSASSIRQINHRSRVSTQQVILSDVQNVNRQMNLMDVGVRQRARSLDRTRHHIPIPADVHAATRGGRWRGGPRPAGPRRESGAPGLAWPGMAWFPARVASNAAQCPELRAKQATSHHSPTCRSIHPSPPRRRLRSSPTLNVSSRAHRHTDPWLQRLHLGPSATGLACGDWIAIASSLARG